MKNMIKGDLLPWLGRGDWAQLLPAFSAALALLMRIYWNEVGPFNLMMVCIAFAIITLTAAFINGIGSGILSCFFAEAFLFLTHHHVQGLVNPGDALTQIEQAMAIMPGVAVLGALGRKKIESMIESRWQQRSVKQASHYEAILNISSDWFWAQDEECRFTRFDASRPTPDASPLSAFMGMRRWETPICYPNDHYWKAHIEQVRRREPIQNFIYRIKSVHTGSDRWFSVDGVPRFNDDGVFMGYSGVARDITAVRNHEMRIAEEGRRLGALVEHTPIALVVRDALFNVVSWNPAAEALFKKSRIDMFGTSVCDPEAPEAPVQAKLDIVSRMTAGESIINQRFSVTRDNGAEVIVNYNSSPIYDDDGALTGTVSFFSDITASVMESRKLVAATANLNALFDSSPLPIYARDLDGKITFWNSAAERDLGWASEEIIGRAHVFRTDARQGDFGEIRRATVDTKKSIRRECKFSRRNGEIIDVIQHVSPIIFQGEDVVRGTVHFVQDMSKLLREERARKDVERVMRAVFECAPEAIIMRDLRTGRVLACNPATERILGWTVEDFLNSNEPLTAEPTNAEYMHSTQEVLAGRVHSYETTNRRKDGTTIQSLISVGPVFGEDGKPFAKITVLRDITHQKMEQRELAERERLLSSIMDNVAEAIIVRAGKNFEVIVWNKAAERLFGWTATERVGQSGRQMLPDAAALEQDREATRLLETRNTVTYECTRKRKDGSLIHVSASMAKIAGFDGEPFGRIVLYRDITSRKANEALIAERDRNIRAIIDHTSEAIIMRSVPENKLLLWNKASERLFGWTFEERKDDHIVRTIDHARFISEKAYIDKVSAGEAITYEGDRKKKNGDSIRAMIAMAPVFNESGEVVARVTVIRDITREKAQAEQAKILALAAEHTADAMLVTDATFRVISVNRAFSVITDYQVDEIKHEKPWMLLRNDEDVRLFEKMVENLKETGYFQSKAWMRRKGGEPFLARFSFSAVRDDRDNITHCVGLITDLSANIGDHSGANVTNLVDQLTGIPRQDLFLDRAVMALTIAENRGHDCAILVANIDRFRTINESIGIMSGDKLLQEAAKIIKRVIGPESTVARTGGDEFSILINECKSWEDVARVAGAIESAFDTEIQVGDVPVNVTLTIGIACYPEDADDAIELLEAARFAQSRGRDSGRARSEFFRSDRNADLFEIRTLYRSISSAINHDELTVHYQPIIDAKTRDIRSVEALLRWDHPTAGMINAERFIPIAERVGIIEEIDLWAATQACMQVKRWMDAGFKAVSLSINISAQTFMSEQFIDNLRTVITKSAFPPALLFIDVDEKTLLKNVAIAIKRIREIKKIGAGLVVSNFGSNLISIPLMNKSYIHYAKIGQSGAHRSEEARYDKALPAIIQLASSYGVKMIASGVETEAQHQRLIDCGFDEEQGTYIMNPSSHQEITRLLQAGTTLQPRAAA